MLQVMLFLVLHEFLRKCLYLVYYYTFLIAENYNGKRNREGL